MTEKCDDTPSKKTSPKTSPKDKAEKGVAQVKDTVSNLRAKVSDTITNATPVQQLAAGTVSGWITGSLSAKVGRIGALAAGGGILLFQLAQEQKLTKMDWDKLKEKLDSSSKGVNTKYCTDMMQKASKFGRTNRCFAAGFIGGFLIGLVM